MAYTASRSQFVMSLRGVLQKQASVQRSALVPCCSMRQPMQMRTLAVGPSCRAAPLAGPIGSRSVLPRMTSRASSVKVQAAGVGDGLKVDLRGELSTQANWVCRDLRIRPCACVRVLQGRRPSSLASRTTRCVLAFLSLSDRTMSRGLIEPVPTSESNPMCRDSDGPSPRPCKRQALKCLLASG